LGGTVFREVDNRHHRRLNDLVGDNGSGNREDSRNRPNSGRVFYLEFTSGEAREYFEKEQNKPEQVSVVIDGVTFEFKVAKGKGTDSLIGMFGDFFDCGW
jgi:hypothetical protein